MNYDEISRIQSVICVKNILLLESFIDKCSKKRSLVCSANEIVQTYGAGWKELKAWFLFLPASSKITIIYKVSSTALNA